MKNRKNILLAIGLLLIGLIAGWIIKPSNNHKTESSDDQNIGSSEHQEIWTCSMHPQIRQNEPGSCPICGMDLIPLEITGDGGDPGLYQMSENAMKLANVQTMVVGRGDASREMRLNGKVQVDERASYSQSTHIPGRIEQLAINFTGEKVSRGQNLATVYSPELVTAQEELLQAAAIRSSQPELFEAAKTKLRNWKIGDAQIEQILSGGKAIQRFSIRADVNGIVTEKMVDLGDYVERGMPIYEISDLSKVWVLFDLYEGQLAWVKEGSKVEFTINSFPGETFEGKISFVDPLLDSQTRVSTARVEVDNKDGRLKPGMFASGVVKNTMSAGQTQELIIPKSAVLWTGKRSIVYVKTDVDGRAGFRLREITLGPSLGDSYVVQEGLEPGEEIVSNGAFTVDAAVQLSGGTSMMNPDGGKQSTGHDHGQTQQDQTGQIKVEVSKNVNNDLNKLVDDYLRLKDALVKDNYSQARQHAQAFEKSIGTVDGFNPEAKIVWESYEKELKADAVIISGAAKIESMRERFDELSTTMIGMVKTFQLTNKELYVLHCPMADSNKGADWLSASSEVKNPYYGSAMLTCGELKETIQ
ncbi:efflux RND transporter periplasmic adaptor subunit [Gillisia limnaea]|uniref:Efflux transporter, RND family, MFP subunit n=1 Tax=Gillisia limnaea (strain DSM 15749 / LMG 21470 / R-8282) TaxID=865937 RepID=H2BZG1_GILLR|nr:efflux RND transporter periplasmic adaptor subunit [Gillisia limnaea]EHQ02324.1 efflux transporter, RND family, MFP subunit [Gillisia limnaea DSM 15749]